MGPTEPTFFVCIMAHWSKDIARIVRELAEPLVEAEGMELVDVEYLQERGRWLLRLTIDKPGGITLDDCQTISRQVERVLDVEDPIDVPYSLEVSSPGIERPLKKEADFERFAGRLAEVRTARAIGEPPRRNYKGRLLGIDEVRTVRIEVEGKVYELPFDEVAKAKLVYDPDAPSPDDGAAMPPEGE